MVNENNAYEAIAKGAFPGRWKRLHGLRGMPDYLVYLGPEKQKPITRPGRQFFVEVKELPSFASMLNRRISLHLRPAQIPFFKDWPGEKYILVRALDTKEWAWFSGKEKEVTWDDNIEGPFQYPFKRPR